jgi:SHS2 domain-containing protein
MSHSFRFLDDIATADLAFDASGDSLQELFHGATCAVIEAMADPSTVGFTWRKSVERREEDPAELLFDWLSDLVYWKDADGVVFSTFKLTITYGDDGSWHLKGELCGESVNGLVQVLRNDVKGITKHMYQLSQEGMRWNARVVVDV